MPASNPGRTGTANPGTANGVAVICSPFSGPTNSPFDARTITGWTGGTPTYANDPTNVTTGALNTGIGFGIGTGNYFTDSAVGGFSEGNFSDDYTPGLTQPGLGISPDARLTAIGGGRNTIVDGTGPGGNGWPAGQKVSVPTPYSAVPLLGFGNGGTRDAGAGPEFTGFAMKTVTATGNVAHGADIETGWANRVKVGFGLVAGQSAFGSAGAPSAAPTELIN